jgi:hypothetical protein
MKSICTVIELNNTLFINVMLCFVIIIIKIFKMIIFVMNNKNNYIIITINSNYLDNVYVTIKSEIEFINMINLVTVINNRFGFSLY